MEPLTDDELVAEIRVRARTRYLAILFAPAAAWRALMTLAAYELELHRITETVRDPTAAEIRLTFWQDALRGEGYGEAAATPLLLALREGIERYGWPVETLAAMAASSVQRLYADPFRTFADFDGYAGEAFGAPLSLGALALAAHAEAGRAAAASAGTAAGYAGVALGAADALVLSGERLRFGRVLVPSEVFQAATGRDLTAALTAGDVPPSGLHDSVRAHGLAALADAWRAAEACDPAVRAALLPGLAVAPVLARGRRAPLREQLALWRSARRLNHLPFRPRPSPES